MSVLAAAATLALAAIAGCGGSAQKTYDADVVLPCLINERGLPVVDDLNKFAPRNRNFKVAFGSACISTAYALTLQDFFGTNKEAFSITSSTSGTTRSVTHFSHAVNEIIDARINSGFSLPHRRRPRLDHRQERSPTGVSSTTSTQHADAIDGRAALGAALPFEQSSGTPMRPPAPRRARRPRWRKRAVRCTDRARRTRRLPQLETSFAAGSCQPEPAARRRLYKSFQIGIQAILLPL
jgi:hypothetical protein